jgi:hypothetical protein
MHNIFRHYMCFFKYLIPLLFACLFTYIIIYLLTYLFAYLHVYVLTIWPGFNPRYGREYLSSPAIQTYFLAYPSFCSVDKKGSAPGMKLSDSATEFVLPKRVEIKSIWKWREILAQGTIYLYLFNYLFFVTYMV